MITAVPVSIAALLLAVEAPWFVGHLLEVGPKLHGAAVVAIRIASVALLARVLGNVVNTPQLVRLRWDLYVLIGNGTAILQIALIPLVVLAGHGVVAATVVIAVVAVLALVLHAVAAVRLQPATRRPTPRRSLVRPLVRYGGALVVGNAVGIVLGNAERFLLAASHPIRTVGYYSVAANLAALLAVMPIAITQPLLPAFSRLFAVDRKDQVGQLYRRALTAVLAVVLPAAVLLTAAGRPLLDVWVGSDFASAAIGPLRVLCLGLVANALALVPYNLLLGANESRTVARCHLLELPLYPLYAFVLVDRWGVLGAAMVWCIRVVVGTAILFVAASRKVDGLTRLRDTFRLFLAPAAVLAVPLAAELLRPDGLVAGIVALPAIAAFAWLVRRHVLAPGEFAEVWAMLAALPVLRRRGAPPRE
jgi:O-antigen/teichoic acid export membrane protein